MLNQTIEQAHQRDRLEFKHLGQIDLGQSFLLPQSEQHDPLGARGAAALGAMVDVVAQQTRGLDKLCNNLTFKVERHGRSGLPKLSDYLGFSNNGVFAH